VFLSSYLWVRAQMMQEAEDKEIDNNSRLQKNQHYANCRVANKDDLLSVARGKQKTNCVEEAQRLKSSKSLL
jgi:hypothetical protein